MCTLTKLPDDAIVQCAAQDGHIDTEALIAGHVARIDVCAHGYHWAFEYHDKLNRVIYGYVGLCPDAHPESRGESGPTFESFLAARQKAPYRYATEYAAGYRRDGIRKDLIFTGPTGTGKTHLARAVARVTKAKGFRVEFVEATGLQRMFGEAESWNDDYGSRDDARRLRQRLLDADLVVLDDLGTERATRSELFPQSLMELWDARDQRRSWIVTTNLSLVDLSARYGQKVCSRMSQYATACQFTGEDFRLSGITVARCGGQTKLHLVQ